MIRIIKYAFQIIAAPLLTYLKRVIKQLKLVIDNPTLKIVGKISAHQTTFGNHNYISYNSFVHHSKLGDYTYVGDNCFIDYTTIGKFTCIGPRVKIGLAAHPSNTFMSIHPMFYSGREQGGIGLADKSYFKEYDETFVGNDVWIGANVIVNGGIKIGDGAIIASGAVVTKDVEPYSIVGGVPARLIKMRFDKTEVEKLHELAWWNKDINWLRGNFKYMHNINNVDILLKIQ